MIKAVIFDMDGLMIDTEKLLMRFWIESANSFGFDMTRDDVLSIRSLAGKLTEKKLKKRFGDGFDYQKVRAKRIELMNNYILKNGIEKKKGLDELLVYMKNNGYKTAVATATDLKRASMYLDIINVTEYFDKIVCATMVQNGKPHPDIYLKACEELDVLPCEAIALEDSPNGIISAHSAGCKAVMVPDLSEPDEELRKILFRRIDSLDLLIDVLKNTQIQII